MSDSLPDRKQQILAVHASFIHSVVFALLDPEKKPQLEQHLQLAEQNGWQSLCAAIRNIMNGLTDPGLFNTLDEEDNVIVQAILAGLQNTANLPPIPQQADPAMAAPGLAQLIQSASRGDVQALKVLGEMAGQMAAAGGSMARLGASLKLLLDGERNPDRLSEGMDEKGQALVASILREIQQDKIH